MVWVLKSSKVWTATWVVDSLWHRSASLTDFVSFCGRCNLRDTFHTLVTPHFYLQQVSGGAHSNSRATQNLMPKFTFTLPAPHSYCLQVSGGANIANSTTQNPVAASMGTLPLTKQVALMTAVVSTRGWLMGGRRPPRRGRGPVRPLLRPLAPLPSSPVLSQELFCGPIAFPSLPTPLQDLYFVPITTRTLLEGASASVNGIMTSDYLVAKLQVGSDLLIVCVLLVWGINV